MGHLLNVFQSKLEGREPDLDILQDQLHLFSKRSDAGYGNETQRLEVIKLLRRAVTELEKPSETLRRIRGSPLPLVTARIGQSHNIFETLNRANEPIGIDQLEHASGIKAEILDCIMEYLDTQGIIAHDSQGRYNATKLSHLMTEPRSQALLAHRYNAFLVDGFAALDKSLFQQDGPPAFNIAFGERFYAWLETHEVYQNLFYKVMEFHSCGEASWLDVVDFETEFAKGGKAAFVDVGGGVGQKCHELLERHPGLKDHVVLQDLPEVLEKLPQVDGIKTMGCDFNTEQPIKGARVYYLRQVLHNYTDEACIRILQTQKASLDASSIMVIDDKVLPDVSDVSDILSTEEAAVMSITMLVLFKAHERRESHWRRLLDQAGLVLREVRRYSTSHEAVMIVAEK